MKLAPSAPPFTLAQLSLAPLGHGSATSNDATLILKDGETCPITHDAIGSGAHQKWEFARDARSCV